MPIIDMRGILFTIGVIHTPAHEKMLKEKMAEAEEEGGLTYLGRDETRDQSHDARRENQGEDCCLGGVHAGGGCLTKRALTRTGFAGTLC